VLSKILIGALAAVSVATTPSWQITKQVSGGSFAEFTAVIAIGRNGGWAFDGQRRRHRLATERIQLDQGAVPEQVQRGSERGRRVVGQ
jgi:hypothetical protein